jgi:hypothetical protein
VVTIDLKKYGGLPGEEKAKFKNIRMSCFMKRAVNGIFPCFLKKI